MLFVGEDGLKLNEKATKTSINLSNLMATTMYKISITAVAGKIYILKLLM